MTARSLSGLNCIPWDQISTEPCGDVVRWVREKWYDLPTPYLVGVKGSTQAAKLIKASLEEYPWKQQTIPREGDVVLAGNHRGGHPHHCGVWMPGGVLHWFVDSPTLARVVLQPHGGFAALFPLVEYWRLREC